MTTDGAPTHWGKLPVGFFRSGSIQELRRRNGASGMTSFLVLIAEATTAYYTGAGRHRRGGEVKLSWAEFERLAAIPDRQGQAHLHELRDLDLIELRAEDKLDFTARLIDFARWQEVPKDVTGADRSKRYRERKKTNRDDRDGATARHKEGEGESEPTASDSTSTSPSDGFDPEAGF